MPRQTFIYFDGLNGLRFAGASMIVIFHSLGGPTAGSAVETFFHNLPVGVDFFFIISGFLITYLLLQEKNNTGRIHIGAFYLRRILRIFPLYYFIILLSFLAFHNSNIQVNYLPHLYFWGNFETIKEQAWIKGWLHPLWSLCVEEHFYWVVPLLIAIFPTKGIKFLYGLIIIASIAAKAYFSLQLPLNWFSIYCHTLSKMDVIAMGGLLACIHFEHPISLKVSPAYCLLCVLLIITIMSSVEFNDYSTVWKAMFIRYMITLPFFAFFILYIFNSHPVISRMKSNASLNYLGSISFGIYMYHSIVTYYVGKWIVTNSFPEKFILIIPVAILSIGTAAISFKYFETPFLRLKQRLEWIKTRKVF